MQLAFHNIMVPTNNRDRDRCESVKVFRIISIRKPTQTEFFRFEFNNDTFDQLIHESLSINHNQTTDTLWVIL